MPPAARWSPHVTVAAVIERDGRYLLVEEHTPDGLRLNNPAGHLEPGESLLEAVVRETLEETARVFTPTAWLGAYLGPSRDGRVSYLRWACVGTVGEPLAGRGLDAGIVRTLWLTRAEVHAAAERCRSPSVLHGLDDHAAGVRLPLSAVRWLG